MSVPPLPARDRFPHLRFVGVLGGIGSGKSTVARLLAELGAIRIDADELARALLDSPAVRTRLEQRLGPTVLDEAGNIDRQRVAAAVFVDDDLRGELESWIHPEVRRDICERLEFEERRAQQSGTSQMVVLDIPLLVESGWSALCDHLIFVDAEPEERLRRVARARGWSASDWQRRESKQTPIEEKRRLAQTHLRNHNVADLRRTTASLFEHLQESLR